MPPTGQVRAVLPSLEVARDAIAGLENRGLDASLVHFDEETQRRAGQSDASHRTDDRVLDRAGSRWRVGLALGILIGGALGALGGAAIFGFQGRTALVAALAFGVGLGAAGAGLGVFAGGVWGQKQSGAWEDTFEAPGLREVTLLVDVTSDEESRLASAVLREYSDRVDGGTGGQA